MTTQGEEAVGRIPLPGLDGRNPLGFLAALGTLRLLSEAPGLEPRLSWNIDAYGVPRAELLAPGRDQESVADSLVEVHLARDLDEELGWDADIMKISREQVRQLAERQAPKLSLDLAAALVAELPLRPNGSAPYTPFRLIPRVGRARLLGTAKKAARGVRPQDFENALFERWKYKKGVNSLRLDPGARLGHRAYAAEAPTNFGPLGVRGATVLAVAGLTAFPLQPMRRSATCRGFAADRGRFIWPVWNGNLNLAATRLLLGLPELYEPEPDVRHLRRHGVTARLVADRERRGDDDEGLTWGRIDVLVEAPERGVRK